MQEIVSQDVVSEEYYLLSLDSGLAAPSTQIRLPLKLPSYLDVPDLSFGTVGNNIFQVHRETLPTTRLLDNPKQKGEFCIINEVLVMNLVPCVSVNDGNPAGNDAGDAQK
ncbi:Hypothetical protein GLP15_3525 [Giardia lamblia P15]|uniref:Uncharacterized protein n=1 Tax=Giardia intestinalis (strain P15) TaxID=658858 RepID=E1F2N7_GIAIA|nr:Hypothetical protein GLP15_3525 [Giardia lamblia P15]